MVERRSCQQALSGNSDSLRSGDAVSPALGPPDNECDSVARGQDEIADQALVSEQFYPAAEPSSDSEWYAALVQSGVPPLIAKARIQFRRDLPMLRDQHPGKRVAYSGDERIGVAETKRELVIECLRRGLKVGDFLVQAVIRDDEVVDSAAATENG